MRWQYQAVNGFSEKVLWRQNLAPKFFWKNIASHFPSTRSEHFLFFFFFFWKIFSGAKFFKPKLCSHTKYAPTQCTAKRRNRQSTFWTEDATQENPFVNLARTALFIIAAVPKNSKPFTGPFTPSGKTDSFTRAFAAQSLKCFASATWKRWYGISFSLPFKSPAFSRKWCWKSKPHTNWSRKLNSRQQHSKNYGTI